MKVEDQLHKFYHVHEEVLYAHKIKPQSFALDNKSAKIAHLSVVRFT